MQKILKSVKELYHFVLLHFSLSGIIVIQLENKCQQVLVLAVKREIKSLFKSYHIYNCSPKNGIEFQVVEKDLEAGTYDQIIQDYESQNQDDNGFTRQTLQSTEISSQSAVENMQGDKGKSDILVLGQVDYLK